MHAAMAPCSCGIYCRVCGQPWEAPKGLALEDAIAMKWWELDALAKGLGCPECKGFTPEYIKAMKAEDAAHVDCGFTIQWMQAIKKACNPGQPPYPEFPDPFPYDFFMWAEPTIGGRFSSMGKEVEELIASIDGGADALRVHPEAQTSEFDTYRYGIWHIVPPGEASMDAETSSVKYMNAVLLRDVFAGKCDVIGGSIWVLIGTDYNGALAIDVDTLSRVFVVEKAIKKYGCLTPEIYQLISEPKK